MWHTAHRTHHTPGSLISLSLQTSDDMAPPPRLPPRSTTIIISAPRAFFFLSFPFPHSHSRSHYHIELVRHARTHTHTHTQNTDPLFSLCFLFFCLLLPSALRSSTTPTYLRLLISSTPPTLPLPTYIYSSPSSKREARTVVCKFPNVWMVAVRCFVGSLVIGYQREWKLPLSPLPSLPAENNRTHCTLHYCCDYLTLLPPTDPTCFLFAFPPAPPSLLPPPPLPLPPHSLT